MWPMQSFHWGGVLDENDPDNARFMVLIRNAMEDLQRQVETERSLYHKSRDDLSAAESQSRRLETELNLEKERNSQLVQELERLEQFMSEQNENVSNMNSEEADNYWRLYKEALSRIDELEGIIQNDKCVEELEMRKTQLEGEIDSYKEVILEYKSDNQKLMNEVSSLKEARDLSDQRLQDLRREYDGKIHELSERLSVEMIGHESLLGQYTEAKESLSEIDRVLRSNEYSSLEELISAVQIKSKEIDSWRTKFHDLETSAGVTNEKEIELHEREISVVSKEGYLDGKEASLTHLEERLRAQEQTLNDKAKELERRSLSISNLEREIVEKQKEFESCVDDLNLREQSFNRMVEDYSANMEKAQLEHVSDYNKKTAEIESARSELESGRAEYERLRKEVEKSRAEVEAERSSLEQMRSELEQEQGSVAAGKAEAARARAELEARRSELDKQEVEFRSQRLEFSEKQRSLNTLQDELVSLEKTLSARSRQLEEGEREMHARLEHAKADNLHKLSMQYESQLKALEGELGDIRKELDESKRALKQERDNQSVRMSQMAVQESRLRDLEERERSVKDLEGVLNSQKVDLENKQKEFDVYINELESRQKEFEEFWLELDKRQKSISSRERELDNREALLNTQRAALSESERKSFEERETHLYEKEARLKDKEGKFIERENRLADKENKLMERENRLMEKEKGLLEREMGLNDLEREVSSLGQRAKLVEETLLAREVKVEERESTNRSKESTLGRREAMLMERECSVDRREADLRDRDQELKDRERDLDERERQIQLERKPLLDELIRIEERDKQLFERELAIQRSEDLLQEMEGVIKSREKELLEGGHSSKDKEICELRQMIGDLELRNKDIERETQRTCQVLQQQIQEEMKQKEELLYTILHLHKQINSIGSSLGQGQLDGVAAQESRSLRRESGADQVFGAGGEPARDSSGAVHGGGRVDPASELSVRNSDVISSLEKTMKKLYEKLQATESREKNLLKELRQFTERSKSSRARGRSVSPFAHGAVGPDAGGAPCESSALPGYPGEVQEPSHPKQAEGKVPVGLQSSQETANSSRQQILPTLTNNSPVMYPESPMVLMPLLTDIKNELNELKKSNESNIHRTTQTDEKFAGGIPRAGERSNLPGIGFTQPGHSHGVACTGPAPAFDNSLSIDCCMPSGYCHNPSNSLPASSNMNPPAHGSLMNEHTRARPGEQPRVKDCVHPPEPASEQRLRRQQLRPHQQGGDQKASGARAPEPPTVEKRDEAVGLRVLRLLPQQTRGGDRLETVPGPANASYR
ncbi:hypothetical protein OJ252_660 [Cryptosporidium canis]|uniref:Uncharacterized protein n=1 Tax=Cryptosporidium canis TaxID=195482 RepID=A0ABQ8PA80_9CRYT|nr:hypothetical protein OJ252_660 [Cryptosporidium canis]